MYKWVIVTVCVSEWVDYYNIVIMEYYTCTLDSEVEDSFTATILAIGKHTTRDKPLTTKASAA